MLLLPPHPLPPLQNWLVIIGGILFNCGDRHLILAVQVGLQERHGCASDIAVRSTFMKIKNHHSTITIENRTHVNRIFFLITKT
jgi:hypothetical protein